MKSVHALYILLTDGLFIIKRDSMGSNNV